MDRRKHRAPDPGGVPAEDPKLTAAKIALAETLNQLQSEFPWATITGRLGGKTGYALVFNCGRPKCPADIRGYAEMVRHLNKGVHKEEAARGAEAVAAEVEVAVREMEPVAREAEPVARVVEPTAAEVEVLDAMKASFEASKADLHARLAVIRAARKAELAAREAEFAAREAEPAPREEESNAMEVEPTPQEAKLEQTLSDLRACYHGAVLSGEIGGEDGDTFIFRCYWHACTGTEALETDDMVRHLRRKDLHPDKTEGWTALQARYQAHSEAMDLSDGGVGGGMFEVDSMNIRERLRVREIILAQLGGIEDNMGIRKRE